MRKFFKCSARNIVRKFSDVNHYSPELVNFKIKSSIDLNNQDNNSHDSAEKSKIEEEMLEHLRNQKLNKVSKLLQTMSPELSRDLRFQQHCTVYLMNVLESVENLKNLNVEEMYYLAEIF